MAQVMLKRKDVSGNSCKNNSDVKKKRVTLYENESARPINSRNIQLLSTTYPLNSSASKKINVGLVYDAQTECLIPKIQLLNAQYSQGVLFVPATWYQIHGHFDNICRYFYSNSKAIPDPLSIDDINILFRTSYGVKSIIFEQKTDDNSTKGNKTVFEKQFAPAVVMQDRTFSGLRQSIFCVQDRLNHLCDIASEVNQCKNLILNELKSIISNQEIFSDQAVEIVKCVIQEKSALLKETVKNKIRTNNAFFIEKYFNIAFLELTTIYKSIFHHELLTYYSNKDISSEISENVPPPNQ